MKSPVKDIEDYIKQEDYHSFFLQGLVHNYYMFLDVFEEWLGKSTPLPPHPLFYHQECLQRTFLPRTACLDIQKILLLHHYYWNIGRFSLSTRKIYYEALC